MKSRLLARACSLTPSILAACFCFTAFVAHGAGLTVTPAAVSNAYTGEITLAISGLTNGEPVIVERFQDPNSNGTIQAGEPLLLSFRLTEGQLTWIAGVRDRNVPGDDDGATNASISSRIRFLQLSDVNRLVGSSVFRVSSPEGRFAAVTAAFAVTNSAHPFVVSGNVISGANAAVGLLDATLDGEFLGGTLANAAGDYSIRAPAGAYRLVALRNGFVFDGSAAPLVLVSNQNVTQNLLLVSGNRTLSGQLRESASGAGLPGVALFIESTNGLITLASTDGAGHFSAGVVGEEWSVGPSESALAWLGCLAPNDSARQTFNTSTGGVSGVEVTVPRATALFHGRLQDNAANPLAGIEIFASQSQSQYNATSFSDTNGNYSLGVLAGDWFIAPYFDDLARLGFVVQGTNSPIAAGQALRIDFTARQITAFLRGQVTDEGGTPLPEIELVASGDMGGNNFTRTAGDGTFSIGVFGGNWTLSLGSEAAVQQGLLGPNLNFTVIDGTDITNIHYVARGATAQITGFVRTTNSEPVAGVNIYASIIVGGTNYSTRAETGASGGYTLPAFNGSWEVGVECNGVNSRGYECPTNRTVNVSGGTTPLDFTLLPIRPLQVTTSTLPDAVAGTPYDQLLSVSGGVPPYSWSLAPGSAPLPPGMNLSADGFVSGQTSATGAHAFTVRVTDWKAVTDDQVLSITVRAASPLQIVTTILPDALAGVPYSIPLQVSGGAGPYAWSIAPGSGPLPPGFGISSNGILSGVTSASGVYNFTVRVSDVAANVDDQPLALRVTDGARAWTHRPFLARGRVAPAAVEMGGLLYAIGGFTDPTGPFGDLEVYNPQLGDWRTLASMPTPRGRLAAGIIDGRLYAAGGFGGEQALEVYDPASNTWSTRASMAVSRLGCAAGVISNQLYVVGGTPDSARTLEVYDPVANAWSIKAPLPTPRYLLAAGVISNRLYAVGGVNSVTGGPGLATLEVYDPATDSWTERPPMPTPRADLAAAVINNRLYVVGGFSMNQLEIYDPTSNAWSTATGMPTARGDLAAAAVGPRLFAIGGTLAPGQTPLPLVEQYSPAIDDRLATRILTSEAAVAAAGLGTGAPSTATLARLDAGDSSGLVFSAAAAGAFGSGVSVPVGAPPGTQIINISAGGGQNGFFRTTFQLPEGFAGIQLSLAANVDFYGRAFLNGSPITPPLSQAGRITQNENALFTVRDATLFRAGTNELLIADANSDGGASGAAFYAFVTYRPVPVLNPLSRPSGSQFELRVGGTTNETYALQFTTDFVAWTTLVSTNPAGAPFHFLDTTATNAVRYYRTVVVP